MAKDVKYDNKCDSECNDPDCLYDWDDWIKILKMMRDDENKKNPNISAALNVKNHEWW